jgi:P27 family predicted phage terminase small subunit
MAGRKPHPFQIVEANAKKQKTSRKKIEGRKNNQPSIDTSNLICPEHISPEGKEEWKRIVDLYRELNQPIINDLDINALEIYCESLVTYRKAMLKVRETSEVYKSEYGPKVNPWLKVANDASIQVKKYGDILLLDPVSRARVGLAKSKNEEIDPMEALIRGG